MYVRKIYYRDPEAADEPSASPALSAAPDSTEILEITEEPVLTEVPISMEDPADRSVYDSDVSDSYLAKLSAYYTQHAKLNTPYIILRPSQYVYMLVYGDTSNYRQFTDATVVQITLTGSYYNTSTVSVSSGVSYTVDPTGSTAFIYSSGADFLPSRYISFEGRSSSIFVYGILVILLFAVLSRFLLRVVGIKK